MPVWIDSYPMDLAVTEMHGFESEATEHPVEKGADVTDHVRAKPITIALECIVSDTPLAKIASDATRQGSTLPSADAYAHLLAIRNARQPVTVETSLGSFASMALISLSVPRENAKSGGLFFSASFQQITIVENKRTTVRVAIPIAKRTTNYGTKASGEVTAAVVTWRKGAPPGGPIIIGTEQVNIKQLPGGLAPVYYHADGAVLNAAERWAFDVDMKRDAQAEAARNALFNENNAAAKKLYDTSLRKARVDALTDAKNANPGKYVDPKLFGL